MRRRREFTKRQRAWIARKIAFLRREEGLPRGHALGKAFGMARQKFKKRRVRRKKRRR